MSLGAPPTLLEGPIAPLRKAQPTGNPPKASLPKFLGRECSPFRAIARKTNNYSCVLPAMAAATSISAATYKGDVNLIDVSSEAKEQYKVVSVPHLLPRAKALYSHRSHAAAGSLVDDYLRALLPHVEVRDTPGRRLGVDDIIPFSAGTNRGAYFNFMHWDSDWTMARRHGPRTTGL